MIYLITMRHDLIITQIQNDHAKKIIARLICQEQSIPLQKALQIVTKPPFVFLIDASEEEIQKSMVQFKPLGIIFRTIDSTKISTESSVPIPDQTYFSKNSLPKNLTYDVKVKEKIQPVILHDSSLETHISNKPKKFNLIISLIILTLISLPIVLIRFPLKKQSSSFLSEYNGVVQSIPVENIDTSKKNQNHLNVKKQLDSPVDKTKSNIYTDSASAHVDDYNQSVKYYLLAISFNKHNYKAWYGLINTYYNMYRPEDARKAEEEMRKLFGDVIFNINKIIEPYGTIISAESNQDSIYSIEYKSNESTKKALMNETFQIIRALKSTCNCKSISLFASHTAGTGMIVHIRKTENFISLSEFENKASITYLK